jgi:hypothetical protein
MAQAAIKTGGTQLGVVGHVPWHVQLALLPARAQLHRVQQGLKPVVTHWPPEKFPHLVPRPRQ